MDRIVIKSNDRELIDAVWSLQIENDRLPDWCASLLQPNRLAELTVYLREDDITFALAAALFEFMEARNQLRSKTTTEIHTRNYDAQLKKLVRSYDKRIRGAWRRRVGPIHCRKKSYRWFAIYKDALSSSDNLSGASGDSIFHCPIELVSVHNLVRILRDLTDVHISGRYSAPSFVVSAQLNSCRWIGLIVRTRLIVSQLPNLLFEKFSDASDKAYRTSAGRHPNGKSRGIGRHLRIATSANLPSPSIDQYEFSERIAQICGRDSRRVI